MPIMEKNKPVPKKFLTFDKKKLENRIDELKNLLFYRMLYKKYDKLYYNYGSILEVYLILREYANADDFVKLVLENLLFY